MPVQRTHLANANRLGSVFIAKHYNQNLGLKRKSHGLHGLPDIYQPQRWILEDEEFAEKHQEKLIDSERNSTKEAESLSTRLLQATSILAQHQSTPTFQKCQSGYGVHD
ncbi:hypothetical protein Bbelb_249590 [Branchiostoma belcheri]|nr:hypothetical protein Bbelb_249590 [Branchiostoma belcheri]